MQFPRDAALRDHYAHFHTLSTLRPPRVARGIAWVLIIGIVLVAAILALAPWLQTAAGSGQVVAPNPADRPQAVTALVPGRVEKWFVQDGERVEAGQPIARIVDLDPQLLDRLRDERAQVLAEIAAAENAITASENAARVAQIDVGRSRELLADGLIARRDYETAQIRVADLRSKAADARAKLAESRGKLNRIDVSLSRQGAQMIVAPRDGRIQQINANATAGTYVSAGAALTTLAPENPERLVELMVDGRDVALIRPGRPVRLEFEGWPAIQISGWPGAATGLFDGRVRIIDPTAQTNGLFRVLVEQSPGKEPWPDARYIRVGAKVRGWIQMETVRMGYELWRQLNDFPLEFRRPADEAAAVAAAKGETTAR